MFWLSIELVKPYELLVHELLKKLLDFKRWSYPIEIFSKLILDDRGIEKLAVFSIDNDET